MTWLIFFAIYKCAHTSLPPSPSPFYSEMTETADLMKQVEEDRVTLSRTLEEQSQQLEVYFIPNHILHESCLCIISFCKLPINTYFTHKNIIFPRDSLWMGISGNTRLYPNLNCNLLNSGQSIHSLSNHNFCPVSP